MTAPTLSICIPTYQRATFLDYLLSQAADWHFSFTYDIVISDNASPDDTQAIVQKYIDRGLPITYYRQPFNKGGGPNVLTTFHRARGRYIMYLGDDDLLAPEGLEAAVACLQARPDLQALYAPWEMYNDIDKTLIGYFFTLDRDYVFGPGQEIELLELIHRHHVFPEHMIYRADVVRTILLEPHFCYWAFAYLANIVARGPVAFLKTPFYRSVLATTIVLDRARMGTEQAMTDWDIYRGGLEYFVYVLLKRRGITLNIDGQREIRALIDSFITVRMNVALRLWRERRDFVRAYDLVTRLHHLNPAGVAEVADLAKLQITATAQILARFANAIAELDRIVVVGAPSADSLRTMLSSLGLREDIVVTMDLDAPDAAALHGSMVFLVNEADRQRVLDLGYIPGLVISEQELSAGFFLL